MTNPQRLGVLAAALVVLVVAFVALSGGGEDNDKVTADTVPAATTRTDTSTGTAYAPKTSPPAVPTVQVRAAKPVGGVKTIAVKKGDQVRFAVSSPDTSDEIHLHGYDIKRDLKAGGKVTFAFKADAEGLFEVELEGNGEQIAELRVDPG